MKKSKILVVLFAFFLLLVGCGKEVNPEENLQTAFDKMAGLKSFEMQMKATAQIKMDDMEMAVDVNGNITIDEAKSMYMKFHTKAADEDNNIEMYMKKGDNQYTIYTQADYFWNKQVIEFKNEFPTITTPKFENAKKISSKDGITVYEIKITKEELKQLVDLKTQLENMEGIKLSDLELNFDDIVMTVSVNKENYITKFEFSAPLSFKMKVEDQTIEMNITMNLTADLSKFDEIKEIVIPKEVEELALDEEGFITLESVDEYLSAVEWDAYQKQIKNGTYTNTRLEYTGNRPTKVELKIENEDIVSGIIELNGYTATLENGQIKSLKKNQ